MLNVNVIYKITAHVIVWEYSLVAILLTIVLLMRLRIYLKDKMGKIYAKKITFILKKCMQNKQDLSFKAFKKSWFDLKILLHVIKRLDSENVSEQWRITRLQFLLLIMLPIARRKAYSTNVFYRIYATETFCLLSEPTDEKIIVHFFNDSSQFVRNCAALSAVRYGFKAAIKEFVVQVSKARWFYRTTLAYYFNEAHPSVNEYVASILQTLSDPYERATCYNFLIHLPKLHNPLNIKADLNSTNLELKISVHKYLAYVDPEDAISVLIDSLQDKEADLRLTSIHSLNGLNATKAVEALIKCLHDPIPAIQLSAAKAILKLSKDGEKIVKEQSPNIDLGLAQMPYLEHMLW